MLAKSRSEKPFQECDKTGLPEIPTTTLTQELVNRQKRKRNYQRSQEVNFQSLEASKMLINHDLYQNVCTVWQATRWQMFTFKQVLMKKAQFSHGCKQLGADQS